MSPAGVVVRPRVADSGEQQRQVLPFQRAEEALVGRQDRVRQRALLMLQPSTRSSTVSFAIRR